MPNLPSVDKAAPIGRKVTFHARCDVCGHYVFEPDQAVFVALLIDYRTGKIKSSGTTIKPGVSFPPTNVRTLCLNCAEVVADSVNHELVSKVCMLVLKHADETAPQGCQEPPDMR